MRERNSNFELLRIILMVFVVILHYNNVEMGGALGYTTGINKIVSHFIEAFSICAVNCFVMISGYFMVDSFNRKVKKVFELFLKVIVYGIIMYLIGVMFNVLEFKWSSLLIRIVPQNYYVTLYCVLFICSLFYNILIRNLSSEWFNKLIVILILLFAVWPTAIDIFQEILKTDFIGVSPVSAYGNDEGYTLIQFSLMYILGAYVRRNKDYFADKGSLYGLIYFASAIIIWMMSFKFETSWEYCNVFVVLESFALFVIFMNLNIHNTFINYIAKHVFGVYILHTSAVMIQGFWGSMDIGEYASKGLGFFLLNIIVSVVSMCLICTILDIVFEKVMIPFNALLEKLYFTNFCLKYTDYIDK